MNDTENILLRRACLQDVSLTCFSGNRLAWIVLNWQSALYFKTQPRFCGCLSDILNFRGSQTLLLSASSSWEPAQGSYTWPVWEQLQPSPLPGITQFIFHFAYLFNSLASFHSSSHGGSRGEPSGLAPLWMYFHSNNTSPDSNKQHLRTKGKVRDADTFPSFSVN